MEDKYYEMTKEDLIKRIELLENMEIGIEIIQEHEIVILHPDKKISNICLMVNNSQFSNKEHLMFTVKSRRVL